MNALGSTRYCIAIVVVGLMRLSVGTIVAAGTFPAAARTHDGLAAGAVAELRLTPYYILEGMGVAALCQRILRFFVVEVAARLFLASFKVFRTFKVFKVLKVLKAFLTAVGALALFALGFFNRSFGAKRAARGAETVVVPFEDDIFAQFTFERTVEGRQLDARRKPYLVEIIVAVADNPGVVALEHVLELRA